MKSLFLSALAAFFLACNHAPPAPTAEPATSGPSGASMSDSVDEVVALPPELDLEAWARVPDVAEIARRGCAVQGDEFTKCTFTGANGFEARVQFRAFDSSGTTQFECESRAGAAAGPTLHLGAGYSRWETADAVLVATDALCLSIQVLQNGALDRQESLRVGTELAENAASLARAEAP